MVHVFLLIILGVWVLCISSLIIPRLSKANALFLEP